MQIKYPDGSKVSIGSNSKLVTERGTKAVQSIDLRFGKIHALIHKQESEELHFRIKTKTATMGVRGTQFFVDVTPDGKSTTHVINGRVDVAKDDKTLVSGKGEHVFHGGFVEAEKDKISETKHFDAAQYLKAVAAEQPELIAFAENSSDETSVASDASKEIVTPAPIPVATPDSTPAAKPTAVAQDDSQKSQWATFRIAGLGLLTKSTSASFTGMISWNPQIHLIAHWSLGWDLGYTNVKLDSSSRSSAFEYAVVGSFMFNPSLSAEIKLGAQTWFSPTTAMGGMGGLALKYGLCDGCFINHLILGDDVLSMKSELYNIVRVGIGFKF